MIVGTPEQCVERLRRLPATSASATSCSARSRPGDARTMELFAREVAPAMRAG